MGLRYSFRHLFFGGKLNKRRLYNILEDLDTATGGDTADIEALETVVGDSSNGLVKDVADAQSDITALETAIGDESTEGTILARIKALEDA